MKDCLCWLWEDTHITSHIVFKSNYPRSYQPLSISGWYVLLQFLNNQRLLCFCNSLIIQQSFSDPDLDGSCHGITSHWWPWFQIGQTSFAEKLSKFYTFYYLWIRKGRKNLQIVGWDVSMWKGQRVLWSGNRGGDGQTGRIQSRWWGGDCDFGLSNTDINPKVLGWWN